MQFVNEYTTSRKYVPNELIVAIVIAIAMCLFAS
jgi:hypothetical protein